MGKASAQAFGGIFGAATSALLMYALGAFMAWDADAGQWGNLARVAITSIWAAVVWPAWYAGATQIPKILFSDTQQGDD